MLTPEEFNAILERVHNGTASADDLDRLGRSQPKTGEPVTFNIPAITGRDFHFGDTIIIPPVEIKTREFNQTSPYKGLKPFEPEDKDRFFGRNQFIKNLVNELEQTNLILLLGASGSGKSSVVRAGLIPWLQQSRGNHFVSLMFTPDRDPFESLYGSLLSRGYNQISGAGGTNGKSGHVEPGGEHVETIRDVLVALY